MVKVKIYQQRPFYKEYGNDSIPVSEYLYCVYFFGFLINSVLVNGITRESAESLFGSKIIPYTNK